MQYRARTLLLAVVSCAAACATSAAESPGTMAEADAAATSPKSDGEGGSGPPPKADAAAPAPTPDTAVPTEEPDSAAPGDDAATADDSAAPAPSDGPAGPPPGNFTCTLIIGINATSEWYTRGFENLVDNGRWEIVRVHSGFVTLWADPKNGVWGTGPSSACTQNANNPDRVIFVGLQFDFTMLSEWLPPLQAVVKNLKDKYSNLKNIELATFVRAPGNNPCPQAPAKRSTIAPAEDEAITMVAAMNPGLVTISPKFEALNCNEFSGNPPHPSAAGGAAWAKRIADYYNGK